MHLYTIKFVITFTKSTISLSTLFLSFFLSRHFLNLNTFCFDWEWREKQND